MLDSGQKQELNGRHFSNVVEDPVNLRHSAFLPTILHAIGSSQ